MKKGGFLLLVVFLALYTVSALAQNDTGWQGPSQDFGDFSHGDNAYYNDDNRAKAKRYEAHTYWGYGFNLSPGAEIMGIEVRLDADPKDRPRNARLYVKFSWDGGTHWTSSYHVDIPEWGARETYILGGPTDTWGHAWGPSEVDSSSFRCEITASFYGHEAEIYLYWIPVKVYYTELVQDLSLTPPGVDFETITETDYNLGYKGLTQTVTITSSTTWALSIKASTRAWTYVGDETDPLKLSTGLQWKSASSDTAVTWTSGSYAGMTTSEVQVAAGNPGENITVELDLKILVSYQDDPPGDYSVQFVFNLTESS